MHRLLLLAALVAWISAAGAFSSPVAPVLPAEYTISFTAHNVGPHDALSQLYYDYNNRRQVSFHTNCIAGPTNVSSLPCAIQMVANTTLLISPLVSNGCCRFPDGDVPMPPPNAYTFWSYKGNMTINGQPGYAFTDVGFLWVISQSTSQPLMFQFGSGGQFFFTSAIKQEVPSDDHFIIPGGSSCFYNLCPFCWFPGDGKCN